MTKARDNANGGFGLVLVKPSTVVNGTDNGKGTVSFTTASSVSLNDVFSATYDNYLIKTNLEGSTDNQTNFRLRVGGADNSASNYYWSNYYNTSSDSAYVGAYSNGTNTFWKFADAGPTTANNGSLQLFQPFLAKTTTFTMDDNYSLNPSFNLRRSGATSVTTSYTGFTILTSTGTISGTVSVYGYNN
jgi:hypothetical protein